MILFLVSCVFSVAIGFISYYLAYGLDLMMDWGSIFSKIRYKKFLKYAKDNHKDLITKSALVYSMEAKEGESKGTTRANHMAWIYSDLAAEIPKFKLWVCTECMSVRIASCLNLIMYIAFYFGLNGSLFLFLNIPITFIISISIIYYNIKNG